MSAHAGRRKLTPKTWIAATLLFALAFATGLRLGLRIRESPTPDIPRRAVRGPISWTVPEALHAGDQVLLPAAPDPMWTTEARVAHLLREERDFRAMAEFEHEKSRAHFEPDGMHARLQDHGADHATIVVDEPESLDPGWDFLVRENGMQRHFAVVRVDGDVVRGSLRAELRVAPEDDALRGVLLLRPLHRRIVPQRNAMGAFVYELRLLAHAYKLGWASNAASLAYSRDPAPRIAVGEDPFRRRRAGRVMVARELREQTYVVLGFDAGLQLVTGTEVWLSRGHRYVGRARIVESGPDRMVARFDPALPGKGAPPVAGDTWRFH